MFNLETSVLEAADYSGEGAETFESFEGNLIPLLGGYPEVVQAVDGTITFAETPDEIRIVGFDWSGRGFEDGISVFCRLSDGTDAGPNSQEYDIDTVAGDILNTDGPPTTTETCAAKTFITRGIVYGIMDSVFAEEFEGTWTAAVGF